MLPKPSKLFITVSAIIICIGLYVLSYACLYHRLPPFAINPGKFLYQNIYGQFLCQLNNGHWEKLCQDCFDCGDPCFFYCRP